MKWTQARLWALFFAFIFSAPLAARAFIWLGTGRWQMLSPGELVAALTCGVVLGGVAVLAITETK